MKKTLLPNNTKYCNNERKKNLEMYLKEKKEDKDDKEDNTNLKLFNVQFKEKKGKKNPF